MNIALKERLIAGSDILPTCNAYSELLDIAVSLFHITKDAARHAYGNYSYSQWKALLLEQLQSRLHELKQQEQCGIVNTHKIVEVEAQIKELKNKKTT